MNRQSLHQSLEALSAYYKSVFTTPESPAAQHRRAALESMKQQMLQIEHAISALESSLGHKYNPDQPRDNHGRWTSGGLSIPAPDGSRLGAGTQVADSDQIRTDGVVDGGNARNKPITLDDLGPEPANRPILPFLSAVGMLTGTGEVGLAEGALPEAEAAQTADQIANGHAFDKHVIDQGEFPDIQTPEEFSDHIQNILQNPDEVKTLARGRTAYWDDDSGTMVIRDPSHPDLGTAFKPRPGKVFFDDLDRE